MKTTKILRMLMVFFCFIGMTACNDDDCQPFNLDVEAFELPIRGNHANQLHTSLLGRRPLGKLRV